MREPDPAAPGAGAGSFSYRAWGFLLWLLPLAGVCVMVAVDPAKRSVTPVFHLASERWWARGELYADVRGFHYLPQFALLFAPFHALPPPLGDILWRILSVALVAFGIRAALGRARPADTDRSFFFASLLALAPCLGAMRNGQSNLAFAGLAIFLVPLLASSRWGWASVCLVALVAVKPLGVIFLLLAPFVYRPLIRPVAVAFVLFGALPFLFASPGYAIAQYRSAVEHLAGWSATTEHRFADLGALLRAAGLPLAGAASLWLRALAGTGTLLLWIAAAARRTEPWRALVLVLLASIYLMLFNPMTEKNTYAIIAPVLAVAAASCLASDRGSPFGWALAFALVSIGILPELFWRLDRDFGLWWDPLVTAAIAGYLVLAIIRRRAVFPEETFA